MQPWEQRDADRQLLELSTNQTASLPTKPTSELRYIRELAEMVIFVVILFFLVVAKSSIWDYIIVFCLLVLND
jgi:hypothetical protein